MVKQKERVSQLFVCTRWGTSALVCLYEPAVPCFILLCFFVWFGLFSDLGVSTTSQSRRESEGNIRMGCPALLCRRMLRFFLFLWFSRRVCSLSTCLDMPIAYLLGGHDTGGVKFDFPTLYFRTVIY